jgi:hypothetical protein
VVLGVLRASKRTLAGSEPKKRLQDKGPDMKNEDSTCLTLTRSYRIEPVPGTLGNDSLHMRPIAVPGGLAALVPVGSPVDMARPALNDTASPIRDRLPELRHLRADLGSVALECHLGAMPARVLSDRGSRARREWRMRSPPAR